MVHPLTFITEAWYWGFAGLAGFAAYKVITAIGFALLRRGYRPEGDAPRLLLLRVFALGRLSEQFFDRFSKWWLRAGSVQLISRPDLVDRQVGPHEFLGFAPGNEGCRYELEQRLDLVDLNRVAIVIDDSTDRAFLEATLTDLWTQVDGNSPNRQLPDPTIHLFHARKQDWITMRALLLLLAGASRQEEMRIGE